jgi:two-component system, NtrC family, nitrogen regulation sensor histidine kinase NtrY
MTIRAKMFLIFLVTVLASVSVVAYGITRYVRAAFEEMDTERSEALVAQFKKEYAQRRDEIAHEVKNIADSEITLKAAIDLARPNTDQSLYFHDANGAAQDHGLDFVEFVNWDGTIVSSAQYPAHVGHKYDWITAKKDWNDTGAFLKREELSEGVELALSAVRTVSGGNDRYLYIIGGQRLDQNFLSTLVLPSGMRALLYRTLEPTFVPAALTDIRGPLEQSSRSLW